MLPAARARLPDASSISATSVVTVVFPLVPVTATIGARAILPASSTSLTRGARPASAKTGWRAGTPGLTTTRSGISFFFKCSYITGAA